MRYHTKRTYKWSGSIAYSAGLIASDGCLQKDGRHIDLTSKDREQLVCFSKALNRDFHIGNKLNGNKQSSLRIQFSDVAYYDFLMGAGITPAKSHTLANIHVPDRYYPDFLRGVFDGDGTSYSYFDPRWSHSFMFYLCICSASNDFLTYLQTTNRRLLGTLGGSIRHNQKASILAYAKKDSQLLYQSMYKTAVDLYLPRKRMKLENFINQSGGDTIVQSLREW